MSKFRVMYFRYILQLLLFKGKNPYPTKMLVWKIYLLCLFLWQKGGPIVEYSKREVWRNLTVLRKTAKLLTRIGFLVYWRVDSFWNPMMNCCTMELSAQWIFHIGPSWRKQKVASLYFFQLISLVDVFVFGDEIRKRKANWIGHILRTNCKYYVERKGDTPSMHYPAAREAELVDFCRDCII